jgi:hypothetical protein
MDISLVKVEIDPAKSLEFLGTLFLKMTGHDALSKWFADLQKIAIVQSSEVQCMGMHHPLKINQIYQPTRLIVTGLPDSTRGQIFNPEDKVGRSFAQDEAIRERVISVAKFLDRRESAIVKAGPGWGKTTFLHHVYLRLLWEKKCLPVLISLRRESAVQDLEKFVGAVDKLKCKEEHVFLLVDGYDEVSVEQRKRVSESILKYKALKIGCFYLTCRDHYPVYDIAAPEVHIGKFSKQDQYEYVETFLKAFGSTLNSVAVVDEFHNRGLEDFLSHPLLLALACIVKTSNRGIHSRSVIRLIEEAILVLTFRWDYEKGVDRKPKTPLSGTERIQLLKQIAYTLKSRHVPEYRACSTARNLLDKLHYDRVDPKEVLLETAQFFGMFVPSVDGWEFVHRTIHDYLAAQLWVETGDFAKETRYEWNARTAYAACLLSDATSIMQRALRDAEGVEAFVEILENEPQFDHKTVAEALIRFYSLENRVEYYEKRVNELKNVLMGEGSKTGTTIRTKLQLDFLRVASTKFLDYLAEQCSQQARRDKVTDTIIGYCLFELQKRRLPLSYIAYPKLVAAYKTEDVTFNLIGLGNVSLSSVKPSSLAKPAARPAVSS